MDRSKEKLLELVKLCGINVLDGYIYLPTFKTHPNTHDCYYDINNNVLYEAINEYGFMPHDLLVPCRIETTVLRDGGYLYNKIFDHVLDECKFFVELIDSCKRDVEYHSSAIEDLKKKIDNYNIIIVELDKYKGEGG